MALGLMSVHNFGFIFLSQFYASLDISVILTADFVV